MPRRAWWSTGGVALHKMIRLVTIATANGGYLNFMGNEFGHPEWIDFPREGNNWSYHYARRQWSLRDNPELRYHGLAEFDAAMLTCLQDAPPAHIRPPRLLTAHDGDKVLAFTRDPYLFVCNFHQDRSFTDYGIAAVPGNWNLYRIVMKCVSGDSGALCRGSVSKLRRWR
jgi:1,4-alpha-glucan branching enzyme